MVSPELRLEQNVPGPFYVTSACIDCDMCRETAPGIYRRNDDIGFSVVYRQPSNKVEWAMAKEGLESCPVEAIGCTSTELVESAAS